MKFKAVILAAASLAAAATSVRAGELSLQSKEIVPQENENWEFKLALPVWINWLQGDNTIHGHTAHINLGPDDIIPRVDMVADVKLEAHKGRFSLLGEFLYLSLSDGVGTKGPVKKMDLQVDQTMSDFGMAWRVYESPKAYVDILGGVRYSTYYQQMALQPNDRAIEQMAGKLAVAPTAVNIAQELQALLGKNPTVPIGPLDANLIQKIQAAINKVTAGVSKVKGAVAQAKTIPETVAKRQQAIEGILHHYLSGEVSRFDNWWDPYVGARARYNFTDKYYLSGRADIGGFGVGSELSWQAEAAFGMVLSKNLYTELGYRALGLDYDQRGMHMETVTHGFELTMGLAF